MIPGFPADCAILLLTPQILDPFRPGSLPFPGLQNSEAALGTSVPSVADNRAVSGVLVAAQDGRGPKACLVPVPRLRQLPQTPPPSGIVAAAGPGTRLSQLWGHFRARPALGSYPRG